ncbi:MAG: HAMP domain-containing protein [Clostridia bacterium]|nr:HAMP domain-containing protein [Clostridia bacterium]MBR4441756.1 HAMP domain-containing protein [Clostridia bacterium]
MCVSFYIVSATLIRLVGEYLFNQKADDELSAAVALSAAAEAPLCDRDADALWALARDHAGESGRVLVLDLYGTVQADSLSQLNGTRFSRREAASVLNGHGADYGYYFSGDRGAILLSRALAGSMVCVYAAPIGAETLRGVLVYITMSQSAYRSLMNIQTQMLTWLVLVTIAVMLVSLFVSRFFTRPISELNEGIVEMTRGDFSNRVRVRGKNEFAQLAVAFNMMCDRIESLDKARNQFVSNASHELKTPLSTMKILIETLMYQDPMDPGMTREFLTDINKEIDRLSSVISDLLTLVSIDGGEKPMDAKPIAVADLLSENMRRLQPLARERGIEMTLAVREQATVTGDASRLTQVFYNLMDNAIKYTGRGGTVRVELSRREKRAIVKVIDTGIGIPKEDQQHVFDRFYRVDKARSRDTGGTGLGLSIVKQIVLMHGGRIEVASEENKGSTFTVDLPETAEK